MGTSRSFAEFEKKLNKAADDLKSRSDDEILLTSAKRAKKTIAPFVKQAVPSGALTQNRTPVGVFYRKQKTGAYLIAVRGPMQLVERNVRPHSIPLEKGNYRTHSKRNRKLQKATRVRFKADGKVLSAGKGGGFYAIGPVWHPGTRGKKPWERGKKAFLPSAGKTLEAGVDKIMRGVFG